MIDLYSIRDASFLQKLSNNELRDLAKEIRSFLIEKTSVHGGHLSGNLGIVDLTIAMEKHYSHGEKFIFDVGHQMYTHKILTGRAKKFDTLRDINGLSGLSSRDEDSVSDVWEVGHASTSLACLSGYVISDVPAIAIIGDGAMSGGEALEGLEFIASLNKKAIIILNENHFSISLNVGLLSDLKDQDKPQFFRDLGYTYIGPVNGHDFASMENAFALADKAKGPTIIHVLTKKGLGYKYTEEDETGKWHCVSPFDIKTGTPLNQKANMVPYVGAVSHYLSQYYAKSGHNLKVVIPAMTYSSSMVNLQKEMGDDFIDTGITEQLATTLAGSLSLNNDHVFLAIYSSFLQRAYDQLHQDIGLQKLRVVIGVDKCGLVGETGKTHQGLYDISYLRTIPNLTILAPKDYDDVFKCLDYAFSYKEGPIVIRYPSTLVEKIDGLTINRPLISKNWVNLTNKKNPSAYFITYSSSVDYLFDTVNQFNIDIISARFIRPLDEELLKELAATGKPIILYEEAPKDDSLGSMVLSFYNENKLNPNFMIWGYPLDYVGVGAIEDLRKSYQMDKESVKERIKKLL